MEFKDRYQKLQGQLKETALGEDRIIEAYRREKPPHPETIVWYNNNTISSFNIEGELGQNSIPDKTNAVKVETGTNVSSIGYDAFTGCSGLVSFSIPESVTSIGKYAFYNCRSLSSITIPNSMTSIDKWTFYACFGLSSITIPDSITSIGDSAFMGCSSVTSITIPNSVASIGDRAFGSCYKISSVTIPDSVTSIGLNPFTNCFELTSISVSTGNTAYDSRNRCNAIIKTNNNVLIAGCQNTVIPNDVTKINPSAFEGCRGLTSVTIPNGVSSIGEHAFWFCSGLESITIPDSVASIGNLTFSGCKALSSITCFRTSAPANIKTQYGTSFGSSNSNYVGRNTYSSGNNVLKVPQGAARYDSGAWLDPLQNSSKCGFHIEYLD